MIIIKRLKLFFQESTYDCGLACLLSIAKYYDCNPTKDYLEKISMTLKDGTSMYGLMIAAKKLGFESYGKKGNLESITNKELPLIAHIILDKEKELYHYIIITHISSKKVTIKDPGIGTKVITKEEFNKITTGNFLFIKKTSNIKRFIKRRIIKEEIDKLIKNNSLIFKLIILFTIINTGLEILNLSSLKVILNNAILNNSLNNLNALLFIFLYLIFIKTILTYLLQLSILKIEKEFNFKMKLSLIKHLLSLPNLYYQTKEKGVVLSLFNDIDIFTETYLTSLTTFFNSLIVLIFICLFFLNLSLLLSLTLLISGIILFTFIYSQKKISMSLLNKYYYIKDKYNNKLQQVVINNDKIKGLHLEQIVFKKNKNTIDCLEEENYKLTKYSEVLKQILYFVENSIYLLILGISGLLIIKTNEISLPTFLLLEGFIFTALKNIENLSILILKFQNIRKIKERLNEIFNCEKEILIPYKDYDYPTQKISITISNLTFKYLDKKILNNINLKINAKDKIFIYGSSGSGKSTLVKLIGRFLEVDYGKIKIGKIDITHYNLADLRTIITYITNDEMLSNNTIKENIYLSRKPQINQNDILEITGINKLFKEKKYNLKTILNENGNNISMGEKSRINLAQGLFRPSEVYILDECLSNVDIELEKEILEKLIKYYKDKIIIYISHRTANKNLFNKIIYLENGKCYEEI